MDGGSTLFGDEESERSQGRALVAAMNFMGYDALALGEKDFRLGWETLEARLGEAAFPALSANVVVSATGELLARPYLVREVGGHRLAIVGLTEGEARPALGKEGLIVTDPLEAARRYVLEARREAEAVIVLARLGQEGGLRLAETVPGITVVIGGAEPAGLRQPMVVGRTLFVRATYQGKALGWLRLRLGSEGQVLQHEGGLIPLTADFADDPAMRDLLAGYNQ